MPIETPKLNPSTISLPQPGNVIYFVGTDGLLKIKTDSGAVVDFHGTDGNTVLSGSGVPANSLGKAGDFYIHTGLQILYGPKTTVWPTGVVLKGTDGAAGGTGPAGATGAQGPGIISGAGAPGAGVGQNGDFYLNTTNTTLYGPKASGAWPGSGTSLVGPAGSTGAAGNTIMSGTAAPTSGQGNNGDYYIETTNSRLYGPKAAGAWPGTYTSLKGADGVVGSNGKSVLNGAAAPVAGTGVDGDFYIETTNSRLYGPKASGAWPGTYTSLVGPAGPATQWVAGNNNASISTTDFQARYTALGSVEDVVRYYASYGWKGVINIPSGSFTFPASGSGGRIVGLVTNGIEIKGNGSANTTLTGVTGIVNSVFALQGVMVNAVGATGFLQITNSSITTSTAAGSSPAGNGLTFNNTVYLSQKSFLEASFSNFRKGIYVVAQSQLYLGQGTDIILADVGTGVSVFDDSYASIQGIIYNQNGLSAGVGVSVGQNSLFINNGTLTVGKTGQTTMNLGIAVQNGGVARISGITIASTVVGKYMTVNEVTVNGLVQDTSVPTVIYPIRSINGQLANSAGAVTLTSDNVTIPGAAPEGGSNTTISSRFTWVQSQISNLNATTTNLSTSVNTTIPGQFTTVNNTINGIGGALTDLSNIALTATLDSTDYSVRTNVGGTNNELFRLNSDKNLLATLIPRRGTYSTLRTTAGETGELGTTSDRAGIFGFEGAGGPSYFIGNSEAQLSVTANSGTVTLPSKYRHLYLTRSSYATGIVSLTLENGIAPGQLVTLYFDNYWLNTGNYAALLPAIDTAGTRIDAATMGLPTTNNAASRRWWYQVTFRWNNGLWDKVKDIPQVIESGLQTTATTAVPVNAFPVAKRTAVRVNITLSGLVEGATPIAWTNTYSLIVRRPQTGLATASAVVAGTAVNLGTIAAPSITVTETSWADGQIAVPNLDTANSGVAYVVTLTPGDTQTTRWTCKVELNLI